MSIVWFVIWTVAIWQGAVVIGNVYQKAAVEWTNLLFTSALWAGIIVFWFN